MQLNYYLCSDFLLQVNNKMIIFWEYEETVELFTTLTHPNFLR